MASKEAKTDAPAAETKKGAAPAETFAFEFKLAKDKIGEKTTNKQVKAKVGEAFLGYGAFDQCQVKGDVGEDRTVVVFFARLFGKGQPAWDALLKGEKPTVSLYDENVELAQSDLKPSGGGATTGTSFLPKKEAKDGKKAGGRGRGRGRGEGKADGGDAKEGKGAGAGAAAGADAKDGDRKDGGRGRGRGRGKKEDEKKVSLQRGRANIGGKLGPVSKVRLAKQEKERKEKEKADKLARGEKLDEEKPAEAEEKKEEAPKAAGKKEAGKKGEAAKGGDAKKEAGKKGGDAKKEAAKGEAKKEAGKKGK